MLWWEAKYVMTPGRFLTDRLRLQVQLPEEFKYS